MDRELRFWGVLDLGDANAPSVVPALCIVYETLLFLSRRCTAATSLETEAEGVPIGMRQKSVVGLFVNKMFNSMVCLHGQNETNGWISIFRSFSF